MSWPWFSSINFTILINLWWASHIRSDSIIWLTKIRQILKKCVEIFLFTIEKYSHSDIVAYIVKNIHYWSAVKLKNPFLLWIFPGIRPKSNKIWNLFIFFWILFREFDVKIPLSIQICFTNYLAIPKNKQCIRSIMMNLIGLKYDNHSNSNYLTPICFMKHFCKASELQRLHSVAFW